ncbi:hypothetical protein ACHWQZ_G005631 [Mnemiopsis leidyi]
MSDVLESCTNYALKDINTHITPRMQNNFSTIFQNIDGNKTNFDAFSLEMERVAGKFQIIGLAETNISAEESHVYQLEGYNSFYQTKHTNKSKGSGVAIYVDESLNAVVDNELSWVTKNLETLFITIQHNEPLHVGILYRPPSGDSTEALNELRKIIEWCPKKNVYLLGDFNINMHDKSNKLANDFENIIFGLGLTPLISTFTHHKPGCNKTCIDNILTNSSEKVIQSGTMSTCISHHHAIFSIFKSPIITENNQSGQKHFQYYDYNNKNVNKFVNELEFKLISEPPDSFSEFFSAFNEQLDKVCKLERPKCSKRTAKNNPWITQGLITSIDSKHELYNNWKKAEKQKCLSPNLQTDNRGCCSTCSSCTAEVACHKEFTVYRRSLNHLINSAKRKYHGEKIAECAGDSKKTWQIINNLRGKKTRVIKPNFIIDNERVTNRRVIANEFNKYFASLASNLNEVYSAKIKSKSGSAGKQCDITIDITDSPSSLCRSLFDLSKCPCDRSLSSWKIDCSRCHQYWHSECVTLDGLEEKEINKLLNWLCPFCYTAPVATTDVVDSSSCLTCRNTRTLRDANHALEVSAAAANIKRSADNENIAGNMSMLSNETSIKCIEAELKQMHESCQTDIRKLVHEVTELKSELTKLSSAPMQAPPPSHSAILEHDAFLKSVSDKLDAIIKASHDTPDPCHPPEATSLPEPDHLAEIEHHQVPYSDSIAEFITRDEAQRLINYLDSCSYKNENGHSVASFGESYTYTGSKSSSNVPPIPDQLKPLFEKVQSIQTEMFSSSDQNSDQNAPLINSCLINKYEGADSYLPRHSDSEVTIHPESSIFTVSLGQLCDLKFIERKSGSESVLPCPDRSLYHMTRRSQEVFDHMIERGSIKSGVRYSLTFRCVSWTNKNSTCLLGDSNTGLLRFGDDSRGTFGKLMPGRKFWSPRIEDINPVSCMGHANVVLLCGINDIKQPDVANKNDVAGCYYKLKLKINQIKCLSPSTKAVFVCRLLPTKEPQLNLKVDSFNRLIFFDLVPSCKNVVYVEGFEKFAHNHVLADELSKQFDRHGRPDMLHLNRSGARVLAGLIKHSIFLRLNGGVDKRKHRSNVNGRLYRSVASDPPASQRRR